MSDEIPSDAVVIASWQRTADYWAARARRAEAEVARLQAAPVPDDAARASAGRLRAWIETHHVKKHDSDTLDVDHGPIVEWDYCDWCFDHGLGDEWPCMFVMALARPAAGHGAGGV